MTPHRPPAAPAAPGSHGERRVKLTVHTASSLAAIHSAEWDAMARSHSFYLSYAWLRMGESDRSADVSYLLARDAGRLVAALPLYRVHAERNSFYQPAKLLDGRWDGRYLIAGSRRAYTNGILTHPDLGPAARPEAIRALLAALEDRVRSEAAEAALFLYLPTGQACALRRAAGQGHRAGFPLLTAADSAITVTGSSMDDYLASFRPRRRRKIQHEMAVFGRAGYEVTEETLAGCWHAAGPLLGNVLRRYGHAGDDELWRSSLQQQAEAFGDRAIVFGCRDHGRLVGFSLAYPFGDTLHMRLTGFDYPALKGALEYYNLVFYLPLQYLYRHGLRHLHLGRESYAAKVHRGARLAPLWSLAFPERPAQRLARDTAWNHRAATAWLGRYGQQPPALADPGWAMWGCGAGA